jgi:hypothetical protein
MRELDQSLGAFLAGVRARVAALTDIQIGRIEHHYTAHMCTVELICGKSSIGLHWVEERHAMDQLAEQFDPAVTGLRRHEAKRVAEREIRMSTMARFYEVEA